MQLVQSVEEQAAGRNNPLHCQKRLLNPPFFFSLSLSGFTAEPTDNASVSVVQYKADYYVSTETNFMHRLNPEKLETAEKVNVWFLV